MGRKCAVPHCYTGYRKCKEKASLYRVPDDDFFLSKWQEAIAREDRPITPKDYVCEKHFTDEDILRRRIIKDVVEEYQRPRLKPDAIPSIFPDLPEFILKMVKKRRKMPVENSNSNTDHSLDASKENDKTETENNDDSVKECEIKTEPPDANETDALVGSMCETILNNEIDIKTEPEDIITVPMEQDGDNDKNDPNYGPKMHQCDQCEYQTKYPHNLRTHKTKHLTGEDAYLHCEHCPNYKTKWELTYRNHLKIKHGIGKQEVFKCTMCQFETRVKLCLKRHYERHNRGVFEKKLSCTFAGCDFRDESKAILDMHMLSHIQDDTGSKSSSEKAKAFKCTECLYETNSKTHIIKHIKSAHNTGDDTIVSVNAKKSNLTLAEASESPTTTEAQSKEKPVYKCLKCSYKSTSQASLLKHVFKHKYPKQKGQRGLQKGLKAKIWKCPKCPYATFFQHALERHQQTECEKIYLCTDCSFRSDSKPDYIKHTLTHRNISIEAVRQELSAGVVSGEVEKLCVEPDIVEPNCIIGHEDEVSNTQEEVGRNETGHFMMDLIKEKGVEQNDEIQTGDGSNRPEDFLLVKVKEEIHTDSIG